VSRKSQTKSTGIPQGHVGWVEAAAMIFVFDVTKAFLAFPERMSRSAQTAAWSVPVFSALLSGLWIWALVSVLEANPGKDMITISKSLLGPYLTFALGMAFYLFNVSIVGTASREIADALATVILPLTPLDLLLFVGYAVSLYLALKGVEILARMCVAGSVLIVSLLVAIAILSANMWRVDSVFPLLGPGPVKLLKTYGLRQSIYTEVLGIGMIAPYLRRSEDTGKVARRSLALSAAVLSLTVLNCEMVFPFPSLSHVPTPILRVTRLIFLGRFFQRFDAVLVPVWLTAGVLKLAAGMLVGALVLGTTLSIKSLGLLTAVTAVMSAAVSHFIPDLATAIILDFDILRPYSVVLLDGWPLALWAVSRFRSHPGQRSGRGKGGQRAE